MKTYDEEAYLQKYREEVALEIFNRAGMLLGETGAKPSLTSLWNYPYFSCYEYDGRFTFTNIFFEEFDENTFLNLRDFGKHFRRPQDIFLFIPKLYAGENDLGSAARFLRGTYSTVRLFEYSILSFGARPAIKLTEILQGRQKQSMSKLCDSGLYLGIPGIQEPFVKQDHVEANALTKHELARLLDLSLDIEKK